VPIETGAGVPKVGQTWSLLDAQAHKESWKPGGQQHLSFHPGDRRLYVTTQEGVVFVVNETTGGATTPVSFFNAAAAAATEVDGFFRRWRRLAMTLFA
jgi:hypothetical protein